MWILKNSKELLKHLFKSLLLTKFCLKTFDFSTLHSTVPYQKLKNRVATIIWNSVIYKNGNRRHNNLVLGHDEQYFISILVYIVNFKMGQLP